MVKTLVFVLRVGVYCTGVLSDLSANTPLANSREAAENTSVVSADGSGNYLSLHDAFSALESPFSNAPDHTLFIASDLIETQPLVLNRRAGLTGKLTIKPLNEPRTITVFSKQTIPSPFPEMGIDWNFTSRNSCNAVIDGSIAGHDHGLTFILNHDPQTTPTYSAHHGFVFGGNAFVEIKNCRIEHNPESEHQSYAVLIGTSSLRPVNIVGNIIDATDPSGCGILINLNSQNVLSLPADTQITDNLITAASQAIAVYKRDAVVSRNDIVIDGVDDRYDSLLGIAVNRIESPTSVTLVSDNRIVIRGGNNSIVSQGIRTYSASDHEGTLQVFNNMVSLNLDTAPETRAVRGITSVNRRAVVSEIAHNSIYLPDNQVNNEEVGRNFHALGVDALSSNSITIANNMLHVGSRWGSGMFIQKGTPVSSDGNVFGVTGSAVAVTTDESTHTVLADWQMSGGMDTESQAFDPLPSWGSPEDLHLVYSVQGLESGVIGLLQAPVSQDIDGDPRSATAPTPGADERDLAARVGNWTVY